MRLAPGVDADLHEGETFQVVVRYDRTGRGLGRTISLHSDPGSFRARLARVLPAQADAEAVADAAWARLAAEHAAREKAGRVGTATH